MPVNTILGPNGILLAVVDEDTKVDIRRMCGYGSYGVGATGFFEMGFFIPSYQVLELRMNTLTASEFSRVTNNYLAKCLQLEQDIYDTRETVNIDTAAVYKRNLNEGRERHNEFNYWRRALCQFFGIDPGPQLAGMSSNNIILTI
jgi:hypothetical protein